jgi:hypothetical protein
MIFSKRSAPPDKQKAKQAPGPDSALTQYSSQLSGEGLEREYAEAVRVQLSRLGIPPETVEVEVRPAGTMKDGRAVYLCMLRLVKWNPRTSLRLLIALPVLEAKTRQSLDTTWLMDVSHFGGLWVHASGGVRTDAVLGDVRAAITQLELMTAQGGTPSEPRWSASVQAVLKELEDEESGRE